MRKDAAAETDTNNDSELNEDENSINSSPLASRAYELAKIYVGRWDAKVARAIMQALGIPDSESRIKETSRDLRIIRKIATGLRETLDRCKNALEMLNQVLSPNLSELFDGVNDTKTSVCAIFIYIYIHFNQYNERNPDSNFLFTSFFIFIFHRNLPIVLLVNFKKYEKSF